MVLKYKLKLKDVKLEDFKVYLLALFKSILPKKKIKNIKDITEYIKKKLSRFLQVKFYGF